MELVFKLCIPNFAFRNSLVSSLINRMRNYISIYITLIILYFLLINKNYC